MIAAEFTSDVCVADVFLVSLYRKAGNGDAWVRVRKTFAKLTHLFLYLQPTIDLPIIVE